MAGGVLYVLIPTVLSVLSRLRTIRKCVLKRGLVMRQGEAFKDYQVKINETLAKGKKKKLVSYAMQLKINEAKLFDGDFKETLEQIDIIEKFVEGVEEIAGENPPGIGDKFKEFCIKRGRELPSNEMIDLLNSDPFEGRKAVKLNRNNPMVWRTLSTFIASGGLSSV